MVIRTGLARFPNTNYKTSNHVLAYLDMLGGAEKIYKDYDNEFLNHLNMFMEDALSEISCFTANYKEKIFTKIFSDNILYAVEINEDISETEDKIAKIFTLIANLANETFRYGYLMRGSVVMGDFFHNENIVYGEGLVRAVKIEEKEAKYPRIIVQDELANILPQYCIKDLTDNKMILNTFLLSEHFDHISFKLELITMLQENKKNEHIKEKIMWVINYFNSWYARKESGFLDCPQITNEEIATILE